MVPQRFEFTAQNTFFFSASTIPSVCSTHDYTASVQECGTHSYNSLHAGVQYTWLYNLHALDYTACMQVCGTHDHTACVQQCGTHDHTACMPSGYNGLFVVTERTEEEEGGVGRTLIRSGARQKRVPLQSQEPNPQPDQGPVRSAWPEGQCRITETARWGGHRGGKESMTGDSRVGVGAEGGGGRAWPGQHQSRWREWGGAGRRAWPCQCRIT